MKFWIAMVNVPEVEQYVELARYAEELGFDGITLADHLVWPTEIDSKYPYLEDGEVWWDQTLPWPDVWVTLAAMGMATSKLRLGTNIYLAGLRDPLVMAKAVSTLAVLTNNRVVCGVSAGWMKEEFYLAGVDFHTRGKRLNEIIEVARQLWSGDEIAYRGEIFQYEKAIMRPVPTRPIPVWTGGTAPEALKRAARNDGWMGLAMTVEQLQGMNQTLQQYRQAFGKSDEPFDITFMLTENPTPERFNTLDEAGVSNMMVLPWVPSPWDGQSFVAEGDDPSDLAVKKKGMEHFVEQVITPYRG